jgi:G patch domain/KOW motif-containing protein
MDQLKREKDTRYWLRPHIRVRIVSKSFQDGNYYNQKCVVQDVTTRGQCIVKTSKGIVLDGVLQRHLETVIPSVGKQVMVLAHPDDPSLVGQLGKLLEYNSKSQNGLVQIESTYDMETIPFDDMAEYVEDL